MIQSQYPHFTAKTESTIHVSSSSTDTMMISVVVVLGLCMFTLINTEYNSDIGLLRSVAHLEGNQTVIQV